jgi:hypothetical protein
VIVATEEGFDLAVTSVEVRPGETLPVTPTLVELEGSAQE